MFQSYDDSISRINSMALIHNLLYKYETLTTIHFRDFCSKLTEQIIILYTRNELNLETRLIIEDVQLPLDIAIPTGLLINEVVSNACKHAFKGIQDPLISISLTVQDNDVTLILRDNGIGSQDPVKLDEADNLGLTLIHTLARQIEADIFLDTKNGFSYTLRFMI